jgi:hypothetical protein
MYVSSFTLDGVAENIQVWSVFVAKTGSIDKILPFRSHRYPSYSGLNLT